VKATKLYSRLGEIAAELPSRVDAAIVHGAHLVAEDAERRLAPHRLTGELEEQVHVDERQREGVYVIAGDPADPSFAFWGHMLEHGTSHSPPYPFLVPALEANQSEVENLVKAALIVL
jgi:HK97 gp10 family phage protein